jgi:mannan endo-1,4-beta-mannosidase
MIFSIFKQANRLNLPNWLEMQNDCNLVLYDKNRSPLWSSNTWKPTQLGCYLEMQNDGNLVLYDKNRTPLWSSQTYGGAENWMYDEQTLPSTPSSFVKLINRNFYIDSKKFIPVGFNCYWLGLDETYTYPSRYRIEEMFQVAKKMSATAIRSHTLGHSSGKKASLRPQGNILNEAAWDSIDYAFAMAHKYQIRLIAPLTDSLWWYNGNYGDYCFELGKPKPWFWTDRQIIDNFKDYINKWLNHVNKYTGITIKDDPFLFLIELGNELGNIRYYPNNPALSSTSKVPKNWIEEIVRHIKSIDKNHLVLDGVDEDLGDINFSVSETDVFSRHYYSSDFSTPHDLAARAANVNKPFIIGEFDSHINENWLKFIEREENVKGSFYWSMYGHADDGVNYIRHDDGFTLYYKEDSSYSDLLKLANHARRMQGLPEINELP